VNTAAQRRRGLNPSGAAPAVTPAAGFDMRVVAEPWPWAEAHAEAIAAAWCLSVAERPALFDGRVLVSLRLDEEGGVLRGDFVEAPFSALQYWRGLGFPADAGAFNAFGAAVVVCRDGAVLLGEMGAHTANAGRIYFPAGTPGLEDVRGAALDIEGSILRELEEETGLGATLVRPAGLRWVVRDGPIVCCARRVDVDLDGAAVEALVRRHIAADPHPEFSRPVLVRTPADADPTRVPAFVRALLAELAASPQRSG
jgi:8-oxo-dGTP pyrophosphatase MutT (NUDIX family)